MKKSDLYREMSRVLDMCEGTNVEPWECESVVIDKIQPPRSGVLKDTIFAEVTLHVKRVRPRRIILEETEEYHEPESSDDVHTTIFPIHGYATVKVISNKKWREVDETELLKDAAK